MHPPETTEAATKPSTGENPSGQAGIGGWLAFLIVVLVFGRPVFEAIAQSAAFTRQIMADRSLLHDIVWNRHRQIVWAVFFMMSALTVSAGFALWKLHRPVSVKYAIAVLWIAWPGSYIGVALVWLGLGHPLLALSTVVLEWQGLLTSLIAPLIWTAYLRYSERVRNTYTYDEF